MDSLLENTGDTKTPLVVYLSRRKDKGGRQLFSNFAASYRKHPAGCPHTLIVVKKGFQNHPEEWDQWKTALAGVSFLEREIPDETYTFCDLVPREFPDRYILFLTAHSEILVDGWLEFYMRHADPNRMLAAHGAHGTFYDGWNDVNLHDRSQGTSSQIFRKRPRRAMINALYGTLLRWFPGPRVSFENPFNPPPESHLRTNAFMTPPGILDRIDWPAPDELRVKRCTYIFECGRLGFSAQARKAGMEAFVVGSDGRKTPVAEAYSAETFACENQLENMIVADNRTRDYDTSSQHARRRFEKNLWYDKTPYFLKDYVSTRKQGGPCPICGHRRTHLMYGAETFGLAPEKNDAGYYGCEACLSLHWEPPVRMTDYHETEAWGNESQREQYRQWRLRLVQKHVAPGSRCLDIGAGEGTFVRRLLEAGYRCECLESDPTLCAALKNEYGIAAIESDDFGGALDEMRESPDCITAWNILEHFGDPNGFLRVVARKLTPGGFFIASLSNLHTFDFDLAQGAWDCFDGSRHRSLMPLKIFTELAGHLGLETVAIRHDDIYSKTVDRRVWETLLAGQAAKSGFAGAARKLLATAVRKTLPLLEKRSVSNHNTVVFQKSKDI